MLCASSWDHSWHMPAKTLVPLAVCSRGLACHLKRACHLVLHEDMGTAELTDHILEMAELLLGSFLLAHARQRVQVVEVQCVALELRVHLWAV